MVYGFGIRGCNSRRSLRLQLHAKVPSRAWTSAVKVGRGGRTSPPPHSGWDERWAQSACVNEGRSRRRHESGQGVSVEAEASRRPILPRRQVRGGRTPRASLAPSFSVVPRRENRYPCGAYVQPLRILTTDYSQLTLVKWLIVGKHAGRVNVNVNCFFFLLFKSRDFVSLDGKLHSGMLDIILRAYDRIVGKMILRNIFNNLVFLFFIFFQVG